MSDKVQIFQDLLQKQPQNTMARYALAMELAKAELPKDAMAQFETIIQQSPDYVPAYHQAGLLLKRLHDPIQAASWVSKGIEAAERTGKRHAREELEGLLQELSAAPTG